jgi:hypothetical protein
MFCLLYSPKQKFINTKSHVIDIFTSEDMENMSLCIFQYLTVYYVIKFIIFVGQRLFINLVLHRHVCIVFLPNPPIAICSFPIVRVTDR